MPRKQPLTTPSIITLLAMSVLVACVTVNTAPITPSSSLSKKDAKDLALTMSRNLKGGHISGVKDTGSMLPMFHSNAWLVMEEVNFTDVEIGDIVIYKSAKGHLVVHQVVAKTNFGYKVKGINNMSTDQELVTATNFTSRVAAILYFNDSENKARLPRRRSEHEEILEARRSRSRGEEEHEDEIDKV